jgi:tol-pal system protein YbgF
VRDLDQNLKASVDQLSATTGGLVTQIDEYDSQIRQLNEVAEQSQRKLETLQARLDELTTTLYRQLNLTPPATMVPPAVVEPPQVVIEDQGVLVVPPAVSDLQEQVPPVESPVTQTVPDPLSVPESVTVTATAPEAAGNPVDEYKLARDAFVENKFSEALTLFDAFLVKYPTTDLAPNAQFWKAQSHFKLEQYDEAIREFGEFRSEYPGQTARIPMALHQEAVALANQGQVDKARELFEKLIAEYPMDPAADGARERLRELEGR